VLYPTLGHIALDILPAQASSVPCKQLFSGTKQIAEDRRLRLGPIVFEELAIMNLAWGPELYDMAAWNASQVEEVMDFEELLTKDIDCLAWDKELDFNRDLIL
jgi:hAT family C-terminal dimerisation region